MISFENFNINSIYVKVLAVIITIFFIFKYLSYYTLQINKETLLVNSICSSRKGNITDVNLIPKVIYRTWRKDILPKEFQVVWDNTEINNPEYKQVLYSDKMMIEFMTDNFKSKSSLLNGKILTTFNKINPKYGAARADIFRLCILYLYGGIYVDIKSEVLNLSNLIYPKDKMIVSKWVLPAGQFDQLCNREINTNSCKNGEYQQWWVVSIPKHPVLKLALEKIVYNVDNYSIIKYPPCKNSVVNLTGPTPYTQAIDEYIKINGLNDIRLVCPDGNNTFKYTTGNTFSLFPIIAPHEKIMNKGGKHYSEVEEEIVKL